MDLVRSTESAWSDISIPVLNVKLKSLYRDTVKTIAWARWVGKVSISSLSGDSSSQARCDGERSSESAHTFNKLSNYSNCFEEQKGGESLLSKNHL